MKKILILFSFLIAALTVGAQHGTFTDVRLINGDSVTSGTSNGTIFYNRVSNKFRFRQNGSWISIPVTSGVSMPGLNLSPTGIKTSSYSAVVNDLVITDATSASVSITLPSAPADKSTIAVKMIGVNANTYVTTINASGSDTFNKNLGSGGGTSATLSILNHGMILQYASATGIWYVVADDLSLAQLDARYQQSRVYNVERYGAKHDGAWFADGAMTNGSGILTSATAPFLSTDVGKVMVVAGAGSAGVALRTTIASYQNSGQVTLTATASTTVSAKLFEFGTDDTAAIQAADNAAFLLGGDLWFPVGMYIINGALQTSIDGTNPNSQIYLRSHQVATPPYLWRRVKWIGESSPGQLSYVDASKTGVILLSTLITSSGTMPAVVGSVGLPGNYSNFNMDPREFHNIGIQVNSNGGASQAKLGALNGINLATVVLENCVFAIDSDVSSSVDQSGSGTFGAVLSRVNDNGPNIVKGGMFMGWDYGLVVGEHTQLILPEIIGNNNGLVLSDGGYFVHGYALLHQNKTQMLCINSTTLTLSSGTSFVDLTLDVEGVIAGKWYTQASVITDAGNNLLGSVKIVQSNSGTTTAINPFTGALNLNKLFANTVIPKYVNQAGGQVTQHLAVTPASNNAAVMELGTGISTSNDTNFSILTLATTQTGTANTIGVINAINPTIGTTSSERRIWQMGIGTSGATNTGHITESIMTGGVLTQISDKFATSLRYVPNSYFGSVATAPTDFLHVAAGTTSIAPIRVTSGPLPTGGNIRTGQFGMFLTDKFYGSITTGPAIKEFTMNDAALTSGTVPVATTNGRLTDGLILAASTYTPGLTNTTNVTASTAYVTGYYRIGSSVTVYGKVDIDATLAASSATELQIALPIASNMTAEEDLGGSAVSDAVASLVARIKADATSDKASVVFKALSLSNDSYSFEFSYQIK